MAKCNYCGKPDAEGFNCSECNPKAMEHYKERIKYYTHILSTYTRSSNYDTTSEHSRRINAKMVFKYTTVLRTWQGKMARARGEKYIIFKHNRVEGEWKRQSNVISPATVDRKLQNSHLRVQVVYPQGYKSELLTLSKWRKHLDNPNKTKFARTE